MACVQNWPWIKALQCKLISQQPKDLIMASDMRKHTSHLRPGESQVCIHSKADWFLYFPWFFASLFESGEEMDNGKNQYLPRRCFGVTAVDLLFCSVCGHTAQGFERGKNNREQSFSFGIEALSLISNSAGSQKTKLIHVRGWGEPRYLQTCSWKQRRFLIPGFVFPCCPLLLKLESPT